MALRESCSFTDGSVECLLYRVIHLDPFRETIGEPAEDTDCNDLSPSVITYNIL
jgi:hypothetical protein